MDQPLGYILEPALAGMVHNFAAPVEACDNCGHQEEQAHVVTDTAPITPILKDYVRIGELQSLAPEHVEPFLIKKLKWRVVTVRSSQVSFTFSWTSLILFFEFTFSAPGVIL